jgi:hypothetical protein
MIWGKLDVVAEAPWTVNVLGSTMQENTPQAVALVRSRGRTDIPGFNVIDIPPPPKASPNVVVEVTVSGRHQDPLWIGAVPENLARLDEPCTA